MSNPAKIEVAAVPEWLEEDINGNATVTTTAARRATPDVEDPGGSSWLVDESPATRATSASDNVIYAPSRASRASNESGANRTSKTSSKKKKGKSSMEKTEKVKDKKSSDSNKAKDKKSSDSNKAKEKKRSGSNKAKEKKRSGSNGANNDNNNANTDTSVNVNSGGDNDPSAAVAASEKTWGQYFKESFQRDGRLLLITVALLIIMNIPVIKWALYPFLLFSTWIHEMCHGLAALMIGGKIVKLQVFPDSSGRAYYTASADAAFSFVSSAGYQGTAVVGFLLLIFRRTKRGPRTGTMVLACWMILSCLIWIRNVFGFFFIFIFGLVLAGLAWKLPSFHIRNLYVILAMMTSMNAITQVRYLYAFANYVNGEEVQTDAHAMVEYRGGSATGWATLWLLVSIVLTVLGVLFAIPGPDEVADFTCCGVCQDLGCFKLCNYPGQRCMSRLLARNAPSEQESASNTASNSNPGEP